MTAGQNRIRILAVYVVLSFIRGPRAVAAEPSDFQHLAARAGHARPSDLKFTHLTTNDGLSQGTITEILQDRRGFMWFATRDGLNRYDGNAFVVYKHNPNDILGA